MSEPKQIIVGYLFDGTGGDIQKNASLVVEEGIITGIFQEGDPEFKKMRTNCVIDLTHCTILPPLVDCYAHLSASSATDTRVREAQQSAAYDEIKQLAVRNIHYNHTHGVLGLVNFDDAEGHIAEFLEKDGGLATIAIANFRSDNGDWRAVARSSSDSLVSLISGTEVHQDGNNYNAAVTLSTGNKKISLANGETAIEKALADGCDCLLQGYGMTAGQLRQMAEANVLWIPNLIGVKTLMASVKSTKRKVAEGLLIQQLNLLNLAREYGVTTALGTGAGESGIIHGESVSEEIRLFQKAGYSLAEALKCGSMNGADFFGIKGIGLLQPGQEATFLVSRGMPVQLPRKLTYLENIYCKGEPSKAYRKNPVKTVFEKK